MDKYEIRKRLKTGETFLHIFSYAKKDIIQDKKPPVTIFKSLRFDISRSKSSIHNVIYVPDIDFYGLKEIISKPLTEKEIRYLLAESYTARDFLLLCHGRYDMAEDLFRFTNGPHPTLKILADRIDDTAARIIYGISWKQVGLV